jgi:neopullulanase
MKKTIVLFAFIAINSLIIKELNALNQSTQIQRDTIDPEQRLPEGVKRPTPRRIAALPTSSLFVPRLDPQSWWIGFREPTVEVMIHDKNIRNHQVSIQKAGITIQKVEKAENSNYLFLTLFISQSTTPGNVVIKLQNGADVRTYNWELKKRTTTSLPLTPSVSTPSTPVLKRNQGLTTADFVYLIMPDRFANGDPMNDDIDGMNQRGVDRRKMFFRHGGDLQGVINNLDYVKELGVTALWLNPVQENDQLSESYHGYALTDFYNIDRRFGNNDKYRELVDKSHAKGLKIVMDIAPNHVGDQSYFIKDLPEKDWIHQFDTFTRTTYRDQVVFDPYASDADKRQMQDGWFDVQMPDMNTGNPHVVNFMTQSYIWWLEYAGIDAYRIDTYLYNDPKYMASLAARIRQEFPKVTMFGETWVHGVNNQAYSTEGLILNKKFDSGMHGVTDFQLYYSIIEALTRPQGWTEGVMRLYQNLANDFVYKNPYQNVTFIDNHDLGRYYSIVGEDKTKYKSAIAWLLTCRGIPQWYYGAELGFTGFTNPDGKVRQDMPGGWKDDPRSVFTEGGRTEKERDIFNYTKKLANWRKTKTCLQDGKLMQFVPIDGVYVYFRYDAAGTVMVVMNTSDKAVSIDTKRFAERLTGFSKAKIITTDWTLGDLSKLEIGKFETLVLDLEK